MRNPTKSKKGNVNMLILTVAMLVMAMLIGIALANKASESSDISKYQKDFLAKDIAKIKTLLFGTSNNFFYEYRSTLKNFTDYNYNFGTKAGKAEIGASAVIIDDTKRIIYEKYVNNPNIKDSTEEGIGKNILKNTKTIYFKKNGNVMETSAKDISYEYDKFVLNCNDATSMQSADEIGVILLDPGHGSEGDKQNTGNIGTDTEGTELTEEKRTLDLARGIANSDKLKGKRVILIRNEKSKESGTSNYMTPVQREEKINKIKPDIMISFHYADFDSPNILKAYVPAGEFYEASRKEACVLVKSILEMKTSKETDYKLNSEPFFKGIDGVAIIPVNLESLEEDNPLRVLRGKNIGILFELGSINSKQGLADGVGLKNIFDKRYGSDEITD